MSEFVALALFDNPVFQSELLFLLGTIIVFGAIGAATGRSLTMGVFGALLALAHIVTAIGSDIPELEIAMWAVMGLLVLFMAFRLWGHATGEGAPG